MYNENVYCNWNIRKSSIEILVFTRGKGGSELKTLDSTIHKNSKNSIQVQFVSIFSATI